MVMEVARRSTILGLDGGGGKVDGSGVRWKMMFGLVGFSTESEADHDVSPLSELAVHVYSAVSSSRRLSMTRVPDGSTMILLDAAWSGLPALSQPIFGLGLPE